jgi:hypothetical protein
MIFWSLCAVIWFKHIEKMLLQMTSGFLQLESTIGTQSDFRKDRYSFPIYNLVLWQCNRNY